jgi:hypothetical protein
MWLNERPFLGSPGGFACGALTARAVCDQLRKVAHGAPSDCCPAGTRLGSQGKSGARPAAQGRSLAPRAIAALTGSRLGYQGKSGATSCARSRNGAPSDCCPTGSRLGCQGKSGARPAAQGRSLAPRAIAALTGSRLGCPERRGSCCAMPPKPPSDCCPTGSQLGCQGKEVAAAARIAQGSKRAL